MTGVQTCALPISIGRGERRVTWGRGCSAAAWGRSGRWACTARGLACRGACRPSLRDRVPSVALSLITLPFLRSNRSVLAGRLLCARPWALTEMERPVQWGVTQQGRPDSAWWSGPWRQSRAVGTADKIPVPPELGSRKPSEGCVGGSQPQLRKKHGDIVGGKNDNSW